MSFGFVCLDGGSVTHSIRTVLVLSVQLHWHISDDQSFPLEIPSLPLMWQQSYTGRFRYTTEDAAHLVEYARQRAVRVMPEVLAYTCCTCMLDFAFHATSNQD
jgi:hypothetical protein